jgi:hypothetical protein
VIKGAVGRLEAIGSELAEVYARWDVLESRGK